MIYIDPANLDYKQRKELEAIISQRNCNIGLRNISGGSREDINLFIECLNSQLNHGFQICGVDFDFALSPQSAVVTFRANLRREQNLPLLL